MLEQGALETLGDRSLGVPALRPSPVTHPSSRQVSETLLGFCCNLLKQVGSAEHFLFDELMFPSKRDRS